jgi:lysophospholipase L1-like esterase
MSVNYRKRRRKIVFFGDAITEYGSRPEGFIAIIRNLLRDESKEDDYELVGEGVAGDRVSDLYARMEQDVLSKGADVVVIFIGVNDVERTFSAWNADRIVFESAYTPIIQKFQSAAIKVVLCTPTVIGEHTGGINEADAALDLYSDVIRKLADTFGLPLVDLRRSFLDYNKANNPENNEFGMLTYDRIHLNEKGNKLVAEEMWKVLKDIR